MVRLTLSAHAGCHLGPQWSPQCGGLSSLCLWEFLQSLWQLWTPHNFHSKGPHSICPQGPQRPAAQKILEAVATEVTNSHSHCRVTREADAVVWPRKSCYCVTRGPGIQHLPTLDTPFTPDLKMWAHILGPHSKSTPWAPVFQVLALRLLCTHPNSGLSTLAAPYTPQAPEPASPRYCEYPGPLRCLHPMHACVPLRQLGVCLCLFHQRCYGLASAPDPRATATLPTLGFQTWFHSRSTGICRSDTSAISTTRVPTSSQPGTPWPHPSWEKKGWGDSLPSVFVMEGPWNIHQHRPQLMKLSKTCCWTSPGATTNSSLAGTLTSTHSALFPHKNKSIVWKRWLFHQMHKHQHKATRNIKNEQNMTPSEKRSKFPVANSKELET